MDDTSFHSAPPGSKEETARSTERKIILAQYALPAAILIAAVMISSTLLYTRGWRGGEVLGREDGATGEVLSAENIKKLARKDLRLRSEAFDSCFDNAIHQARVDADIELGNQLDVSGTPTFFINGRRVIGALPFSLFDEEIQAALSGTQEGDYEEVPIDVSDYTVGKADAPVTMVEFSDFECPFCRSFFIETFPLIKEQYIGNGQVKFVFKHYPLSFHPNAISAALAVECAGEQGKFWEMHDLLFEKQS